MKETPRKSNKYQKHTVNRTQFYDRNLQNVQENTREPPLAQAFNNHNPHQQAYILTQFANKSRRREKKKHFTRLRFTPQHDLFTATKNLTKEEFQSRLKYNRYLRLNFKPRAHPQAAHRKEQRPQPPRRFHTSAHNTTQTKLPV